MQHVSDTYYGREFWARENLNYERPHFRLEKAARLVNKIAGDEHVELLDVGCGPAALMGLLRPNIRYYGIDIAIHRLAPNLIQSDILKDPIRFGEKQFDIVVAQGVFEYVGQHQMAKFAEISRILKSGGTFLASYVNFDHCNKQIYWPYNNVQRFSDFYRSLSEHFEVRRYFPTSHRWHHDEPRKRLMRAIQKYTNVNVPVISRMFAVEYFFLCSRKVG